MIAETKSFREAYDGWLSGLLEWRDYEQVMALVAAAPEGWWVYDTRGEVPSAPTSAAELAARLAEIDAFLRGRHRASYCGFVYVDDRARPSLVKFYDPRNASACGIGGSIAAFTLSRMQPEPLPFATVEQEPAPGLLGRLFKGSK
ncbi:MAG: hypothetical protein ACK4MF_07745 [Hyphomicrobiaceae bacterium]